MTAYYNEFDPYAAQWLRNLISAGHIAPGDVDERSIADVRPDELRRYTQCHFFAGIGGWSLAARLAGWGDDRPLWTGSCPCQPFSVAGKGAGEKDDRHLWPVFFGLISACRPPVVMGEQVAAAVGKDWLDGVHSDLEGIGYACGAAVVPACAVDAPHRRDRLWFVADANQLGQSEGREQRGRELGGAGSDPVARSGGALADAGGGRRSRPGEGEGELPRRAEAERPGEGDVADADGQRGQVDPHAGGREDGSRAGQEPRSGGACDGDVGDALCSRLEGQRGYGHNSGQPGRLDENTTRPTSAASRSAWAGASWLPGADGKARRVKSGIRLLAHGVPARVGKLRAYGNAIVPQVAAEVIGAYLDAHPFFDLVDENDER